MLFRKKMARYCYYCRYAGKINADEMICEKKGVVPAVYQCRHFRYDPLKRIPARPKPQSFERFQDQDFKL